MQIIEKLSVKAPSGESKLKVLKAIAQEYNIEWDSSNTEAEFNKTYEDLLVNSLFIYYLSDIFFRTGEFLSNPTQEWGSCAHRGFEPGRVVLAVGRLAAASTTTEPLARSHYLSDINA
jgi:hypothetical protein